MRALVSRLAYPRLARWILVGAVLYLVSGAVVLAASAHHGFYLLAAVLKYLGASLFVIGAFFYLLYWTVDHGPDFVRNLRT